MIYYVIKSIARWKKKNGDPVESISYFEKLTTWPLPLSHMVTDVRAAKLFDCKSEAKRFIDRKLGARRGYSVEKVTITPREFYLFKAREDVRAGMQPGAFAEKWSKDENYDSGDWLFLTNLGTPAKDNSANKIYEGAGTD
jgi:hypothetical protein